MKSVPDNEFSSRCSKNLDIFAPEVRVQPFGYLSQLCMWGYPVLCNYSNKICTKNCQNMQ